MLYGRLPGFSLSARGRAQAKLLAEYFARDPLAAVIASPLERAQQTAEPIAAAHGLEVRTDPRLIEASNVFEGAAGNLAWYILRHPRLWRALRSHRGPTWGERNIDMAARVDEAVTAAREEFPGQAVVLVSHQAPIWVERLALEQRSLDHYPQQRRCALASVTTVSYEDGRVAAIDYVEPAAAALLGVDPGPAGRLRPRPGDPPNRPESE